jgi:hypothetical protein
MVCDKEGPCAATYQPVVCSIEPVDGGFVVELGGTYVPDDRGEVPRPRPRLAFDAAHGWRAAPPGAPSKCVWMQPRCDLPAPAPRLAAPEFSRLRPASTGWDREGLDQQVGPCVEQDGAVWFGVRFYEGEGISGVGGIGRFDPRSGDLTMHRPEILRDCSIDVIAHDGRRLWAGTYREGEGTPQPAHGLVRYDWVRRRVEGPMEEEDQPCGFHVTGLVRLDHTMWVATDVGLSRWDDATRRWTHFLPDPPSVRETTCTTMYRRTLDALERAAVGGYEMRVQFIRDVERLRPSAARRLPGPR